MKVNFGNVQTVAFGDMPVSAFFMYKGNLFCKISHGGNGGCNTYSLSDSKASYIGYAVEVIHVAVVGLEDVVVSCTAIDLDELDD